MAEETVRGTRGSTVLVISGLLHGRETGKVRECPQCHAKWSMAYEKGARPRVWKDDAESPEALLDWTGNNAAVECCTRLQGAGLGIDTEFTKALHSILPKPCFDRPFVCVGRPESCTAILIGENPATAMKVDWWDFWSDLNGFDFKRWDAAYRKWRLDQGMPEISPTRRRIVRLREAGVSCLETNVFMNELPLGHGIGQPNLDLLDLALAALPKVSALVAHGGKAQAYVESATIPSHIRIFRTTHFCRLSYAAIDALAAEVRACEASGAEAKF